VHIVLGVCRNVIIYDNVHTGDIQASAGYICSHKDAALARFELVEGAEALWLAHLAVDGYTAKA
jgi:hypothetical protein